MSSSVAIFLTAAAPVCFGFALDRGVPAEAIVFAFALLMLAVAWPFSVAVRRAQRGRAHGWAFGLAPAAR